MKRNGAFVVGAGAEAASGGSVDHAVRPTDPITDYPRDFLRELTSAGLGRLVPGPVVTDADLAPPPPAALAGNLDTARPGRVVQGCERGKRLELGEHVVVDEGGAGEAVAAVHDPMADGQQRVGRVPQLVNRSRNPSA
jgi:hypothetical protein